jgi:hypothetical protein
MCRTVLHTSRHPPLIKAFITEVASLNDFFLRIILRCPEGASFNTLFTTDAEILIKDYNSIVAFGNSILRASFHTRRILAVSAMHRNKIHD